MKLYHFVHTILSVPFCPIPFCPYTILSATILSGHRFLPFKISRSSPPFLPVLIAVFRHWKSIFVFRPTPSLPLSPCRAPAAARRSTENRTVYSVATEEVATDVISTPLANDDANRRRHCLGFMFRRPISHQQLPILVLTTQRFGGLSVSMSVCLSVCHHFNNSN